MTNLLGKKNFFRLFSIGLLAIMLLLTACGGGSNQGNQGANTGNDSSQGEGSGAEDQPFKGKTINFLVPFSPGGGYDTYARMIQPFLEKYTGATVVVQNVSGGGGLVGTNQVYNAKASDLTVGILGGSNLVFAQATGVDGVQFDLNKFQYIARVSADPAVLLVSTKKPYQSVEDLAAAPALKLAATGVGEDDFYTSAVIFKAFGVENYSMVTGWEGSSQWLSAVAAGEIDGGMVSAGSATQPIANGFARGLLQVAPERDSRLADVPTALELVDDANKNLVEVITNILVADRVLVVSPDWSAEDVDALRKAFDQALQDPELLQQAEQAERPISYLSGAEVDEALKSALQSVDQLKPIFDEAAGKAQ